MRGVVPARIEHWSGDAGFAPYAVDHMDAVNRAIGSGAISA